MNKNMDEIKNKGWTTNLFFSAIPSVSDMVKALVTLEQLHKKLPNEESIDITMEAIREDICNIFGGSLYKEKG